MTLADRAMEFMAAEQRQSLSMNASIDVQLAREWAARDGRSGVGPWRPGTTFGEVARGVTTPGDES